VEWLPISALIGFVFAVLLIKGGLPFHRLVYLDVKPTIFYFDIFPGKSTKKLVPQMRNQLLIVLRHIRHAALPFQ